MILLSAFPPEGAPFVEGTLSTPGWAFPGKRAMGCIVCVTTSAGGEDEAPLLKSHSNSLREDSFKKNRPGLGEKPTALASFRVRGALQSLLPKKSTAHSTLHLDDAGAIGEDDGWHPESKDITETRELHLERDHLGNTYVCPPPRSVPHSRCISCPCWIADGVSWLYIFSGTSISTS